MNIIYTFHFHLVFVLFSLFRHLTMLTRCYDSVLTKGCGKSASDPIMGLFREAFRDPYYLRFKYRPNCALHGITITTLSTPTSTMNWRTTPTSHPKSLRERSDDARAFNDARASGGNSKTNAQPPKSIESLGNSIYKDAINSYLTLFCVFITFATLR